MLKQAVGIGAFALCGMAHAGTTETFLVPIPTVGQEYFLGNGIIPGSNDYNGGTVVDAHLMLNLDVWAPEPGDTRESSAAYFLSQVLVPVDLDPAPGAQIPGIIISGADEGWSGTGHFTISRTLDELIGGIWTSPLFYSASTEPGLSANQVVLGEVDFFSSFISVTVEAVPAPAGLGVFAGFGMIAARRRRAR